MRFSFALLAVSLATSVALPVTARAAAPATALVAAIAAIPDVSTCVDVAHATPAAYVAKAFTFSDVHLASGKHVVLATGGDSCVCGNANCELIALLENGGNYHVLLDEYQIREHFGADGTAQLDSHDSAMVSVRSKYRFDGKTYALARRELYNEATQTAKLDPFPVAFATGASSATVSGTTAGLGYPDAYRVVASGGQTLTVNFLRRTRVASVSIFGNGAQIGTTVGNSLKVRLPKSGAYVIDVDGTDSEKFGSYVLHVAIR